MKFINMGRGSGKTVTLIHAAYVTDCPIIVWDSKRVEQVLKVARSMGLDKIKVFTVTEWARLHMKVDKVVVDEGREIIEAALIKLLHAEVQAVTFSEPMITPMTTNENEKGEKNKA